MQRLLQRYRYSAILLREIVRTDFKLRYQGSTLGYLWSLLRPLFMFTILYFVFVRFLKISNDIPHPAVYLLLGIVLWNYFVEVTSGSVGAIVGKGDLLRKINFPKYVIILAVSLSALINLCLNFIVIAIFMGFDHVSITADALLIVPIILELSLFAMGIAFLLSALFVRFRDISYIWDVLIQAGFYGTPIFYLLNRFPEYLAKLMILNPMAQMIQDARYVLVTTKTTTIYQLYGGNVLIWGIPIGLSLLILAFSALYFRSQSKRFAEDI